MTAVDVPPRQRGDEEAQPSAPRGRSRLDQGTPLCAPSDEHRLRQELAVREAEVSDNRQLQQARAPPSAAERGQADEQSPGDDGERSDGVPGNRGFAGLRLRGSGLRFSAASIRLRATARLVIVAPETPSKPSLSGSDFATSASVLPFQISRK